MISFLSPSFFIPSVEDSKRNDVIMVDTSSGLDGLVHDTESEAEASPLLPPHILVT